MSLSDDPKISMDFVTAPTVLNPHCCKQPAPSLLNGSEDSPKKRDYVRMTCFLLAHLSFVFVVCLIAWVLRIDNWMGRLLFVASSVVGALIRVVLSSLWLRAASPRLALIFLEIDLCSLCLVALIQLSFPLFLNSRSPLESTILMATLDESVKFICYLLPLVLRQVRNISHLLFCAAVAGAMSLMYSEILLSRFSDAKIGHQILASIIYSLVYPLWSLLGCGILCHILLRRISWLWAPFVFLVPVVLNAGYLVAVSQFSFSWEWVLITLAFWICSGIVLNWVLRPLLPVSNSATIAKFVHGQSNV